MPYNLPYSEYVDADPTFEDMKSVLTVKVRNLNTIIPKLTVHFLLHFPGNDGSRLNYYVN